MLIPRRENAPGKFNLPYINSRFIFPAIIAGAIIILAVFAKGYFGEISEMKLNDSDKRKVVYSVISDAKTELHDNYMLTPNELNIIGKKMDDKSQTGRLTRDVERGNNALNSIIDSIAYRNIVNGTTYKNFDQTISDTIPLITKSDVDLIQQVDTNIIGSPILLLDKKIVEQVRTNLKNKDSALLAKFNNQVYLFDRLINGDSSMHPDTDLAKALNDRFATITAGDLREVTASRLESKTTLNVSTIIFWSICIILAILAFIKQWSLIPLLGLTTCLYLLTGMTKANWLWFGSWLLLGLVIYLLYGYRKSRLAVKQ